MHEVSAPIFLSICIATYNRADYISETLNSIIPQLEDDVELLVVDGASTDATQDVVRKFAEKEPRIRYVRLLAKGGVDQDYNQSVELARGEFCWLFTDDDLLKPGAVAAVKVAIQKGYDLIVVNAEERDRTLSTVLESQRLFINKDTIYESSDADRFFKDTAKHISFIGAVVIRRSVWLDRDRKSYFGTEFIHVGVIFQKKIKTPIFVISYPYIIIRLGNSQWTPRSFGIWMFKWPKLIWSFKEISHEARQEVVDREPWKKLRNLIIQRRIGGYNLQSYHLYLSKLEMNLLWRFVALVVAVSPVWVIAPAFDFFLQRHRDKRARNIAALNHK
jgi:glycosyltransferase involved in cell wall biosynthesis